MEGPTVPWASLRTRTDVPRRARERPTAFAFPTSRAQWRARAAPACHRPVSPPGADDHLRLRLARQLRDQRDRRLRLDDPPEPVPDKAEVASGRAPDRPR